MRIVGVGVIVLLWYFLGKVDNEGIFSDSFVFSFLNVVVKYRLKVILYIEFYKGRDDKIVYNDVKYIIDIYVKYEVFYKYYIVDGRILFMLYIYDFYYILAEVWV